MLVQKFLHTLVVSHKKHPKTSKGNRVAHKCLQCRSQMLAVSLTNVCKNSGAFKKPRQKFGQNVCNLLTWLFFC